MKNALFILALVLFTSCSKDNDTIDFTTQNDNEIQAYIATNNLDAIKSNSGLYYVIDEQGTGDKPTQTDRVKVAYKGYLTNGFVFDESTSGFDTILQLVIAGWSEGITYFNEGGRGKLLIPAHLAYGNNPPTGIPVGAVLIFDIELIYVNYATENDEEIVAYIADNNLTAQKSDSGLYYVIDELGDGDQPTETDNVTVAYKGYLTNGTLFDETNEEGLSFNLQQVITGWTEGITYFKEGGSGTLLIPAHLAYGNNSVSGIIAPGSVLLFDINLISVN